MLLWSGNMKYIKWICILLLPALLVGVSFAVSAMDAGLAKESLSDEEISDITQRNKFVKITSYTPLVAKCFDVRDDHMVVIGSQMGDEAVIAVYDGDGNFQYGFKTESYGSFRVMWSGENIIYYGIRSALLFEIDKDGNITDISRVANTMENSIYDRDVLLSTTRKVGNSTYRMTNELAIADALPGSFKRIIKTDDNGSVVIYDASGNRCARIWGGVGISLIVLLIFVYGIIVFVKQQRNKMKQQKAGNGSPS